ncbi:hypothetical protein ACFLSJ_00635 [Verrucomicrobiota bacterium]
MPSESMFALGKAPARSKADILQIGASTFRAAMAVLDALAAGHWCNMQASVAARRSIS